MTQTKRQQQIFTGDWSCACSSGWDGEDCSTRLETNCGDGVDNDGGELFFVFVGGGVVVLLLGVTIIFSHCVWVI